MKKLITIVLQSICYLCHGMGVIETNGGNDTDTCPKCSGKGLL
jgi:DnaJ-class molecular chaperone